MTQKATFDRSKFKDKVTAQELKKQDQAMDVINHKDQDDTYAGFHKIVDGENKHRVYPAHPNETNNSFVVPVQRWWLEVEVPDKDEKGKEKRDRSGKLVTKMVRKRVFDGRIHSAVGKDIVDEYIKYLTKILKDNGCDQTEINEKLLPINGSFTQKVNGIVGKPEWVMYTDHIEGNKKTFGRLPVGKAVKMRINDLIARESADEPLGSDSTNPFTDPDDGRLLIITYDANATKANDYYKTDIDSSFDKTTKMISLAPLSDEDLEKFMNYPSLQELYVDCYTTHDFELALEGLKNLDKKHNFGVFDYDEFLDICQELSLLYPEKKEKEEKEKKGTTTATSKPATVESNPTDLAKMNRNQLKAFIKANGAEGDVIVRTTMSDQDIRDAIEQWQLSQEGEEEVGGVEEEEERGSLGEEVEEEEVDDMDLDRKAHNKKEDKPLSAAEKIAQLRKKTGK